MESKRVTVLYFADAARRVGLREEVLGEPTPATLRDLQTLVFQLHPQLQSLEPNLLWSVDEEVVGPETPVVGGCVVGVLPPFSGG